MRICLVGGIFGKPDEYRAAITHTPETALSAGLRARGHSVAELGHSQRLEVQGFDVVHVHHLALGVLAAAAATPPVRLAFTSHAGPTALVERHRWARYVMARASAVVALSETEAEWTVDRYPGIRGMQHVIPNGIDEAIFPYRTPPSPPGSGEPWRLLYVGQLIPLKGVEYLLRALALLNARLQIELDLVYQVSTTESALREEARKLGVSARFHGTKASRELASLYADSHLLTLPSLAESLPSAISEARLVGRPVVATDVGAVREQVAGFGAVVPAGDASALSAAIGQVLTDYESYAALSGEASREARRRYSVAAMVDAHERLYQQMIDTPPRARTRLERFEDACVRIGLPLIRQVRGRG